jgi:hypothetical protein
MGLSFTFHRFRDKHGSFTLQQAENLMSKWLFNFHHKYNEDGTIEHQSQYINNTPEFPISLFARAAVQLEMIAASLNLLPRKLDCKCNHYRRKSGSR